jgi:hypothetical protein
MLLSSNIYIYVAAAADTLYIHPRHQQGELTHVLMAADNIDMLAYVANADTYHPASINKT